MRLGCAPRHALDNAKVEKKAVNEHPERGATGVDRQSIFDTYSECLELYAGVAASLSSSYACGPTSGRAGRIDN